MWLLFGKPHAFATTALPAMGQRYGAVPPAKLAHVA